MSRISEPNAGEGSATDQLRDKATEVVGNLKDAASEQYEHVRDTAEEYYNQGRDRAQQWQHTLEDYVQEQPVKSLLIAAGVGVVLGILWKRS